MGGGSKDVRNEPARKTREQRLVIVAKYYAQGKSYRDIRASVMSELELKTYSLATLKKDIDILLKEWREERLEDTDQAVTLFLERNRQHYLEARQQWDESKEDNVISSKKRKGEVNTPQGKDKEGSSKITTKQVEEYEKIEKGLGDPRFLKLMLDCEEQRMKVYGGYADQKIQVSGANGDPLFQTGNIDLSKLSDEDKLKLLELARKVEE